MYERDFSKKLLVIDGPFKGQRMAREGDAFEEVVSTKMDKHRGIMRYYLRYLPRVGLVWATEANRSVVYPVQQIEDKHAAGSQGEPPGRQTKAKPRVLPL